MTHPDYPLAVLPSYELYQVAHIATFVADRLARLRGATTKAERGAALDGLAAGRAALERALGATRPVALPEPIDAATFHTARGLIATGPRWAEVVSLAPLGQQGWAVIGHVPGLGPVGARMADHAMADAVRQHVLTQPVAELGAWAMTDRAQPVPVVPDRVDLAAAVHALDPRRDRDRAVAQRLLGVDRILDTVIRNRFAGVDLHAPFIVRPQPRTPPAPAAAGPTPPNTPTAGGRQSARPRSTPAASATARRRPNRIGLQAPASSAPRVPRTNAGP
jgi:hypothetical protein